MNLLRLAHMTGEQDLAVRAGKVLEVFSAQVMASPAECTMFLEAVDFLTGPTQEVVIVGRRDTQAARALLDALNREFLPRCVILLRDEEDAKIARIAPFTAAQRSMDGKATAYVCRSFVCQAPTTSAEAMLEVLRTGV